jgi:hypothetical protein
MVSSLAFFLALAFAAPDPWSVGIPIDLVSSPLEVNWVASRWGVEFDYARGRAEAIRFTDCLTVINRSAVTVRHVQVVFGAVDGDGATKRPNLPLDIDARIKPGEAWSGYACRSDGYANGDRGLWLVGWINEVDLTDGTSWHAPPPADVRAAAVSSLRERRSQR